MVLQESWYAWGLFFPGNITHFLLGPSFNHNIRGCILWTANTMIIKLQRIASRVRKEFSRNGGLIRESVLAILFFIAVLLLIQDSACF